MVIIPTYKEAESIGCILERVMGYGYQVVVVDDSPDNRTADIVQEKGAHLIRRFTKEGLASAIRDGLWFAKSQMATWGIVMDAGGTHRPQDVPRLHAIAQYFGYDVVIGSRFVGGEYAWRGWRTGLSRLGTWLAYLLGVYVSDATSGFRCYRLDARLFDALGVTQAKGHAFQFELLTLLVRSGARVGQVAIPYRLVGTSTLRVATVKEAIKTWARLICNSN